MFISKMTNDLGKYCKKIIIPTTKLSGLPDANGTTWSARLRLIRHLDYIVLYVILLDPMMLFVDHFVLDIVNEMLKWAHVKIFEFMAL